MKSSTLVAAALVAGAVLAASAKGAADLRWSVERAKAWSAANPWCCGVNYIPANAINYTAMWDKTGFSPEVVRRELKLMTGMGMNSVRFVMQYKVSEDDPGYFLKALETFLSPYDPGEIEIIKNTISRKSKKETRP